MKTRTPGNSVKCIRHAASGIEEPEDPSLPFRMEINLRPPEFMQVAFVMLYGGSEVVVFQGKTIKDLMTAADREKLSDHPRLRRILIGDSANRIVKRKEGPREPWTEG